jgi:hypothetical protein
VILHFPNPAKNGIATHSIPSNKLVGAEPTSRRRLENEANDPIRKSD